MYDELVNSLRICGKISSADDYCVAFHDGCCEAEPVCMYELMMKAADAIEELSKRVPKTPHGRLIDTDAISLEGGLYEYDEWCKWALEQYQDAPTVIEAEEALGGLK